MQITIRPKAYSYIRMSSEKQISGDSLRRQLQNSRDYAAEHGLDLDETLRDIGVSAYTGDNVANGALGRFLELVKTNKINKGSYLIIESLDRLSRKNVLEALPPFLAILNAGIIIVSLTDRQVYSEQTIQDNPMQLMGSLIVMIRANEESATKSKRVKEAHAKMRDAAMRGEGRFNINLPRWIDAEKQSNGEITYKLNEHTETIRLIYELAAEGVGQMAICRVLTERGIAPFKRAKLGWHQSTVGYLLQTPAVIGTYAPKKFENGKYVDAGPSQKHFFPAAVDDDLYMRVQRTKRSRISKGRKGVSFSNLFMGMTYCAHCQGPMTIYYGGSKGQYKYLRCYNRLRTYAYQTTEQKQFQCTNGKGFRYEALEEAILNDVPEFKLSEIFRKNVDQREKIEIATKLLENEAETERLTAQNADAMTEMFLVDQAARPIFRARINENTERLRVLERERDELNAQRIDIESASRSVNDIERLIEDERRSWKDLESEELYRSRNRVHNAYRRFVQFISFDPESEEVTVIIANGYRAYKFHRGNLVDGFDAVKQGHLNGVAGSMTMEHFTTDIPRIRDEDGNLTDESQAEIAGRLRTLQIIENDRRAKRA